MHLVNEAIAAVRADICRACPTPCEHRASTTFHSARCSRCPADRWGAWRCTEQAKPMRGLGDLVAKVADPIARAIGLDKSKCGCAKRQEALNRLVPFESG